MKITFALLSLVVAFFSPLASSAPTSTPTNPDPIIGNWIYHGKYIASIKADGTCSYPNGLNGTWRYLNNPEIERKYEIIWKAGVFVETMKLSRDGKTLEGRNKKGDLIRAERTIETPK
jgi:hypothetical protein